jgi:subtilisin family serine protease
MRKQESRFVVGLGLLFVALCSTFAVSQNTGTPIGFGHKLFFVMPASFSEARLKGFEAQLSDNGFSVIEKVEKGSFKNEGICKNGFWLAQRDQKIKDESELILIRSNLDVYGKLDPAFGTNPNSGYRPSYVENNIFGSDRSIDPRVITHLQDIESSDQFKKIKSKLGSVKIALLDTGIAQHPSLAFNSILPGTNYSLPRNFGRNRLQRFNPDDIRDQFRPRRDKKAYETKVLGHATGVASIITGISQKDNFFGIATGSKILPIKVCDFNGECGAFQLTVGICKAITEGVDIINVSLSGSINPPAVKEALDLATTKGITVVAAAGNYSQEFANSLNSGEKNRASTSLDRYPVSYAESNTGIIGVGAVNDAGTNVAEFSRRSRGVKLVAPGENLMLASLGQAPFVMASGTSYATAWVTGLVALLKAQDKLLKPKDQWRTPSQIIEQIQKSATLLENCSKDDCGSGLINFAKALGVN